MRFAGDDSYRIGNVTLRGEKYDISGLLGKMSQELNEKGESLVTQFSNKTIAETSANAFGNEQAKEYRPPRDCQGDRHPVFGGPKDGDPRTK